MQSKNLTNRQKRKLILLMILAAGLFARLWLFGAVPGGLNQDEAFAGYEAWALLKTGTDTAGYRFPVYLTAWGSGMNALETYLMLPFVALFGLKVWVIRLPQLLVGLLSIPAMYDGGRRLLGERAGLLAAFLLAVCPWHVLLSRWGLESNLAPGFVLFGLVFFLRGLEDSRFFLLSALFYGLSLYAYATIWPFVPLLLLLQFVYCAAHKKQRLDKWLLLSVLLLGLLALPLLLFLAVNFDLIGEIRTPFFSIPRLLRMRAGEISLSNIPENLKNLGKILLLQSDGLLWNSAGAFGLLYPVSAPFALLGLGVAGRRCLRRGFHAEALLLINALAGLLLGALITVNVNRVNILFIPLLLLTALGVTWLTERLHKHALAAVVLVYTLFFVCFQVWYFTDYREQIGRRFGDGLGEALTAAKAAEGAVYLSEEVYYPQVLFYSQTPVDTFRRTVHYRQYPATYLQAASFGRYCFGFDRTALDPSAVYIIGPGTDLTAFMEAGFQLTHYGNYTLAAWP